MTFELNRRRFIQSASGTVATLAAAQAIPGVFAADSSRQETLNVALIGCGGIMTHHLKGLVSRREAVSISWLCDVDPAQIDRIAKNMVGFQSKSARRTSKFQDVLADPNVDAVIIATPHHWHAPIAINAMAEGKDVYLEKPISHVYNEGHAIIRAAKKYKRVVQQGSQMRNSPVTDRAGKLLADGAIGEIKIAKSMDGRDAAHGQTSSRLNGAKGSGLRPLAGTRSQTSVQQAPLPQHLADVPGLCQRRDR